MTGFWIIATGMVVLALGFALVPLFGRGRRERISGIALNVELFKERLQELEKDRDLGALSAEQFEAAKHDLEQELLYDINGIEALVAQPKPLSKRGRWLAPIVAILVPLAAVTLYFQLGASQLVPVIVAAKSTQEATSPTPASHPATGSEQAASLEEMIARLTKRLESNPEDVRGWLMLGRTYIFLQRYQEAVGALAHAYRIANQDPVVATNYAEALALANRNDLTGRPTELLDQALQKQPRNQKALWLRGFAHYQQGQPAAAIARWQEAAALFPEGSEALQQINAAIRQASAQLDGTSADLVQAAPRAPQPVRPEPSSSEKGQGSKTVTVRVELDESLAGQVAANDTVFIFARAANGPRMPLAIVRKRVQDLPLTVTLDDSTAMSPAMTLSNFPEVTIEARVSKTGTATPESGDLEGLIASVTPGTEKILDLRIDSVHP